LGVAAVGLVGRTWGLGERGLRGITTTTPRRSAVNVLSHAGWQAADKTSDLIATEQGQRRGADLEIVHASTLQPLG